MVDERIKLLKLMDPIKWENTLNYKFGNNDNIQTALIKAIPEAIRIAKPIAPYFKGATDKESLANIHKFIRKHLGYRRDPKGDQLIKMPNRFLLESGDCKSNALFIFSIAKNLNIPVDFKFVNYQAYKGRIPTHVYNVAFDKKSNKFVSIDGTSSMFNIEKKPSYSKTTNFMRVYTLSDNMSNETIGRPNLKKAIQKVAAKTKQPIKKIQAAAKKVADKKPLKKVVAAAKKVALAPKKLIAKTFAAAPRSAFLALTLLNFRGVANKLKAANQAALKKQWAAIGGDYAVLVKNFNKGAAKKPLFGSKGIGDEGIAAVGATVAATFASATPVFVALEKIIGKVEEVQQSKTVQAAKNLVDKNPKLKGALTKLKGKAREQLVKEVAERTGQTPAQVEQFVTDAKEVVNPTEDKAQVDTTDNNPGMSTGKKVLIGTALLGLGYAAFSKPQRAARR